MLNKKSVDDINVKGKRVLVRCDFNVPLQDGKITDENRLVAALPTIKKLVADGGKIILCSHLGKPKGEPKPELSLAPVAKRLTELLGQEVKFVPSPVVVDDTVKAAVADMKDGEIILLENTRYRAEETKNGDEFSTSTSRTAPTAMAAMTSSEILMLPFSSGRVMYSLLSAISDVSLTHAVLGKHKFICDIVPCPPQNYNS